MNCPQCGSPAWKTETEKLTREYQKCTGCGYAPWEEGQRPPQANEQDFKDWTLELAKEEQEAREALEKLQDALGDKKLSIVEQASLRKARRELETAEKRIAIAHALLNVMSLSEQGQMTLHIPDLRLIYQFSWGDYDLFKALKKGWRSDRKR